MKLHPTLTLAFMGGTTALFTLVQPAWAASTQVTAVELTPTEAGFSLVLKTAGDADQLAPVFAVPKGKKWVADVPNTQLRLPKGNEFRQSNPVPGIAAVTVSQVGSGVRITVEGSLARPLGEVVNRDHDRIVLNLNPGEGHLAADNEMHDPAQGTKDLPPDLKLAPPALELAQLRPPPSSSQEVAPGPVVPPPSPSPSTPPKYDVMIPNPKVEITGGPPPVPSSSVPPPFLPRAIAPPLGDMSVSNIDATPATIDLGTNEVVPRLVLREAPVRDVLALLARAAGLNLAFSDSPQTGASPGGGPGGQDTQAAATAAQRTITLDIENEPVQDVFNYVIQLSGFQANRVGRTIFVGERLPLATRDIAARTLRLNQATAAVAAGLLSAQGAETQRLVTRTTRTEEGTGIDRRVREETEQTIEPLAADPSQSRGPLLLSGLSVVADDRLNQVTVIGDSRQVQIASAILKQQDLRKRQVSVNVKVVDVTLRSTESFSSQFSAGIGDAFFVVDNGQAVARFGKMAPANANDMTNSRFGRPIINNPLADVTPFDNPNGTELIRDPVTGEFVRARPNQPGSIFGPGGDPLTPGANIVDPARLPANATTGSPQLFFDRNGIPRSYSELTVGGGRYEPLRNNTNNLITAGNGPARFYDETGTARLFNELTVGGGKFKPLLGADSSPIAVAEEQMWLDTSGTPRRFDELTLGGGNFRPYINEDGEILSLAGDAVAAFLDKNGTPRRFSELTIGGGTFEPFRNPAGNLVQAALSAPQFFDVNGIPRLFSELTVGGGTFAPLFDPNGAPISARAAIQALPSFIGEAAQVAYRLPQVFQYPQQFLAQLNANVETGNAKILTDPTLTVQEGETATIQLGDQVVTNVIEEVVPAPAGGQPVRTINNVLTPVGLDLTLAVERVDDNGFISLRVTPNVATPSGTQFVQTSQGPFQVFRVSTREVSSGLIRLRDGQTMLLAGIITEQDSETVSKVPVLGDLPIVGALFRSRQGQKDRSEIVIAITPNILDDSDRANFGYNYTPSREVQQVLQRSQQVR
ncbi:AMIN domain-containing protein [Trichothermofontia sp.]